MTLPGDPLPVDEALPAVRDALAGRGMAVLVAPPGAGKTTRVPLALLDAPWRGDGRILVLEPRRLAARAAAARMAATLREEVGDTVGLRVRFGSKVSRRTRIEVVTEGVFTRLAVDDPSLEGIAAVLFDEFHERSLDADLGLALALDARAALREDLRVLVMSATLDGARVARLLGDAPVIESSGRAFPVETRHAARDPRQPVEATVADAVMRALATEPGSILAFLPGAAEIRRCERQIAERLRDPAVEVVALSGSLDPRAQERAVSPAPPGRRKVVLATSIAETSLTIEGVRIVIDSGLARVPRFEPDVGVTRLETVRVSRASADQRRGRAGRTEPGVCWRLWEEAATAALEPFGRPEILSSDLSGLVLDLARAGVRDPLALAWLDPPPGPALAEARTLLTTIGAIDADGRLTDDGRALGRLPLPPRLARMVVEAARRGEGRAAALLAGLLGERGLGGDDPHLGHRLDAFRRDRSQRAADLKDSARRWAAAAGDDGPDSGSEDVGALLALAFPERIARHRGGGRFTLANGRGAAVDEASPLAREPFLAVADLAGAAAASRILSAAPIDLATIEAVAGDRIETAEEVRFDEAAGALRARRVRRLGAVVLAEETRPVVPSDATAEALAGAAMRDPARLPFTPALVQWRDRVRLMHAAEGDPWPDVSDAALAATAGEWLAPAFAGATRLADLDADGLGRALRGLLPHHLGRRLDEAAPTHFEAPTGSRVPIDYASGAPTVAIRVQELFGLDRHPTAGGVPIVLELLSPAHRPIQITRDLPGFWRGSWAAVRSEMRGRYPRHPWPENPLEADPTRRAKPRGT